MYTSECQHVKLICEMKLSILVAYFPRKQSLHYENKHTYNPVMVKSLSDTHEIGSREISLMI